MLSLKWKGKALSDTGVSAGKEQWQELKMKGSFDAASPEPESHPDPYGSINDVFNSRDALD